MSKNDMTDIVGRATIKALSDAGFAIVPVDPTERHWEGTGFDHEYDASHIEWWKAMIAAAGDE